MGVLIVSFLIYWLVFFVACFTVVEVAQDQLYDEVTPQSGLKVGGGSLILALMATWLRPSFETMFTSDIIWTVLQALVWIGVFTLILQFHPTHALGLALATLLLVPGLASLGVDSLTRPSPTLAPVRANANVPVRKSLTPNEPVLPKVEKDAPKK